MDFEREIIIITFYSIFRANSLSAEYIPFDAGGVLFASEFTSWVIADWSGCANNSDSAETLGDCFAIGIFSSQAGAFPPDAVKSNLST